MKLTRERLKQIIKEELEETMLEGGDDEKFIPGSGIKNLPTPDQDPESFQTSSIEKEIENLIKEMGLTERDNNAKLLRLTARLADAKDENKQLYKNLIKSLINDMSINKSNLPVQERKKR